MARRQGRRKKFLVDVMLIKLGRWLRILGYDCRIPNSNEIDDDALLEIAKNEKRILLTMDRKLAERKSAVGVIYIPSNNNSAKAQLEYLIRNKIIKIPSLKGVLKVEDFVRCTKCSGQLEEVPKERILEMFNSDGELKLKMPARKILESHRVFWICKKCNQVYWKGSHWRKIIDFVSSLRG